MYHYLRIQVNKSQKEIHIASTDIDTLDWLVEEIQKTEPRVAAGGHKYQNRHFSRTIRGLSGNDYGVAFHIIGLLGQRSWEPFAVDGEFVHFRLKQDND